MKTELICRIEIEDEDSNQTGDIHLSYPCEIIPNNITLSNFEVMFDEEVLRIRYNGENNSYDLYDVDESVNELIEWIKLESEFEDILEDDAYNQLRHAIQLVLMPCF